jgi:hypothetical protein
MKHDQLRSIAHNITDSLASGIGLAIGYCVTHVFDEAAASPSGYIEIDFLSGTTKGGLVSASLAIAIDRYRDWLPILCEKHGASIADFKQLTARYSVKQRGGRVFVTIEDQAGRRSVDEYDGSVQRIRAVDSLGRVRARRFGKTEIT